jgi:hypothetical protein
VVAGRGQANVLAAASPTSPAFMAGGCGKADTMVTDPAQAQRERAVRAARSRWRPWVRGVGQACFVAVFLIGGAVALAEGHHRLGLVGLIGAAILALLVLVGELRRRRTRP